jgi:hypothetical protein
MTYAAVFREFREGVLGRGGTGPLGRGDPAIIEDEGSYSRVIRFDLDEEEGQRLAGTGGKRDFIGYMLRLGLESIDGFEEAADRGWYMALERDIGDSGSTMMVRYGIISRREISDLPFGAILDIIRGMLGETGGE